jgi:hypothetical protein
VGPSGLKSEVLNIELSASSTEIIIVLKDDRQVETVLNCTLRFINFEFERWELILSVASTGIEPVSKV